MQKDAFKMVILGEIMVSQRLEVDAEKKMAVMLKDWFIKKFPLLL